MTVVAFITCNQVSRMSWIKAVFPGVAAHPIAYPNSLSHSSAVVGHVSTKSDIGNAISGTFHL